MREIPVTEVREGDVARSNGKELRVMGGFAPISLIRCAGDDPFEFVWTSRDLAALGVTFWREERKLPDYPGAIVASRDGHRHAVRACDRGVNFAPWLTTDSDPWKTDPELLEWLGPDWRETTTPPARESAAEFPILAGVTDEAVEAGALALVRHVEGGRPARPVSAHARELARVVLEAVIEKEQGDERG